MDRSASSQLNTNHLSYEERAKPRRLEGPNSAGSNVRHPSLTWRPHELLCVTGWERMKEERPFFESVEKHKQSEHCIGANRRENEEGIDEINVKQGANLVEIAALIHLGQELQSKKRREAQARFRARQAIHNAKLVKDVHQLRSDVERLQLMRDSIKANPIVSRDIWNVALAYYVRFHCVSSQDGNLVEFLRATMASDVAFNGGFGPDEMAESLGVLQWFDDVSVDLQSLVRQGSDCIVMTTKTSMTITDRTLQNMFPPLNKLGGNAEKSSVKATVIAKLVGQRIVMDGRTLFYWDHETESMTSVMVDNDFLTPILDLLGSLDEASEVFKHAHVSPAFQRTATS